MGSRGCKSAAFLFDEASQIPYFRNRRKANEYQSGWASAFRFHSHSAPPIRHGAWIIFAGSPEDAAIFGYPARFR